MFRFSPFHLKKRFDLRIILPNAICSPGSAQAEHLKLKEMSGKNEEPKYARTRFTPDELHEVFLQFEKADSDPKLPQEVLLSCLDS